MKKFLLLAVLLASTTVAFAQEGLLNRTLQRFSDPEKGHVTFMQKGGYAWGIGGNYHLFQAYGASEGDGFSFLSLLNVGDGQLHRWTVTPSFSYFVADDLCLGLQLNYNGYLLDSDINLDLRDIWYNISGEENPAFNIRISGRHMLNNRVGGAFYARKYLSFFGSKTFGLFADARLYGNYRIGFSAPLDRKTSEPNMSRVRNTDGFTIGLSVGAGVAIRLLDNSLITVGIPGVGVAYNHTHQDKTRVIDAETGETINYVAHLNNFGLSKRTDLLGIQVGFVHYIQPKSKKR